jgi:signal transduction histidine kinase
MFEAPNPLFRAEIRYAQDAVSEFRHMHANQTGFIAILMGINLMIFIVHAFFFVTYPEQKANLFVSLSGLVYFFGYYLQGRYFLMTPDHDLRYVEANLAFFSFELSQVLLVFAIRQFLELKRGFIFWTLGVYFLVSFPMNLFWYDKGWRMGGALFQILTWAYMFVICLRSSIRGQKGSRVFATGMFFAIFFFIWFVIQGTYDDQSDYLRNLSILRQLAYIFSWLGATGAVSAYLAWDFSQTSRQLAKKLTEVKDLSEKNLAVEKEKQEILAEQNVVLERRVDERTLELNKSLEDLKATQVQLIQSEKMASLGQLTAGIAHEIQNPLNFVNNFSEINKEIIEEVKSQNEKVKSQKGEYSIEPDLLEDLEQNMEKINHHGKRAEGIVKSMLQHSRTSSGQKEPADMAALAEEYLNLAYHGMRAKDKSFNVKLETDFEAGLPKVDVVPQDIGRVLLNLYKNAFHAVQERKNSGEAGYEPKVKVEAVKYITAETGRRGEDPGSSIFDPRSVIVRVSDNGTGIPESIRTKIFQPFFTTKPTGQGTGLGLSLSYDIAKAHGGYLLVENTTGEGTVFVLRLPVGEVGA